MILWILTFEFDLILGSFLSYGVLMGWFGGRSRVWQLFWVYSCSWTTFIFYVTFNSDIWFWLYFWVVFYLPQVALVANAPHVASAEAFLQDFAERKIGKMKEKPIQMMFVLQVTQIVNLLLVFYHNFQQGLWPVVLYQTSQFLRPKKLSSLDIVPEELKSKKLPEQNPIPLHTLTISRVGLE